jgi:hypothetical protein
MIFAAYDKVPFSQYEGYHKYAGLVPGADSLKIALGIFYSAPVGHESIDLVRTMNERVRALRVIPQEFYSFAILNASGEGFDVYLQDEDGLFIACAPATPAEDVLRTAERQAVACAFDRFSGPSEADSGVEGFERINGQMFIWGETVVVETVTKSGSVVGIEPILTNGTLVRLSYSDGYWTLMVGKGARTLMNRPSQSLRFSINGALAAEVTYDMAEKFEVAKAEKFKVAKSA